MELDRKTPSEMTGFNLNLGDKKWENLIRLALNHKNGKDELVKKVAENRSLDSYF
jgi:hypothetical protein